MKLTQNIKYLIKSSLVLLLASSIIYAATNLNLNSGDTIDKTTWDKLTTTINNLENQVAALSSGSGIVSEVTGSPITPSGATTWTLSGLVVNKPLIIGFKGGSSENNMRLRVISGSYIGQNSYGTYGWLLNNGSNSNNNIASWVLIPNSETISIKVEEAHSNITLYAYQ